MTLRKLKGLLLVFFVALALPTSILVYQAYGQLQWETFHQHQQLARELSLRIDARFEALIKREESRSFTEYSFFNIAGSEQSAFLQTSPLSKFPMQSDVPGLLGYFQVDSAGQLQTPIVPQVETSEFPIDSDELGQRLDQQTRLGRILGENRLIKRYPELPAAAAPAESTVLSESEEESGISFFDSLNSPSKVVSSKSRSQEPSGRVADLELDDRYEIVDQQKRKNELESKEKRDRKKFRLEQNILPEVSAISSAEEAIDTPIADKASPLARQQISRINTFESEIETFEFSLLDSGHFVLFRRVWRDGERYVQGLLFDQHEFIEKFIASAFRESTLAPLSDLILSYQGNVVQLFNARYSRSYSSAKLKGAELLYQNRLVAPFSEMELTYSLAKLPIGAGNQIILWSAFVLALVLILGTYLLYRLGARQINLSQQQQDFVSAVSHELKTPLTSIRMYGEMLREGWADESRKKSYYDFIFNESERLSRLINNVLQLARMTRREQSSELKAEQVDVLINDLKPRLESQLDAANFSLQLKCDTACRKSVVNIDSDWFMQIMINLVDNAIKFSANADQKVVDLNCQLQQGRVVFSVRDYGPGIAKDQMKKIFKLFYRSENELTRETVGTGIGLSLVQQLVSSMNGQIDVLNRDPGVEFQVGFMIVNQD